MQIPGRNRSRPIGERGNLAILALRMKPTANRLFDRVKAGSELSWDGRRLTYQGPEQLAHQEGAFEATAAAAQC